MYFSAAFQLQKQEALSCQKVLAMQNWKEWNKAGWTTFIRHRCISREEFDLEAICIIWHFSLMREPQIRTRFMVFLKARVNLGRFTQLVPLTDVGPGHQTVVLCYSSTPSQVHLPRTVRDSHELCQNLTVRIQISAAGHSIDHKQASDASVCSCWTPTKNLLQTDLSLGRLQIRPLMPSSKSCPQHCQGLQQHFDPKTFVTENGIVKKQAFLGLNFSVVSLGLFQRSFDSLLAFIFNVLCLWHKIFSSGLGEMFYFAQNNFICMWVRFSLPNALGEIRFIWNSFRVLYSKININK